jgi:hypothetical protein
MQFSKAYAYNSSPVPAAVKVAQIVLLLSCPHNIYAGKVSLTIQVVLQATLVFSFQLRKNNELPAFSFAILLAVIITRHAIFLLLYKKYT